MNTTKIRSEGKKVFMWSRGFLFYRIDRICLRTYKRVTIVRIPVWKSDAEWLVENMVKGLEWGRIFR